MTNLSTGSTCPSPTSPVSRTSSAPVVSMWRTGRSPATPSRPPVAQVGGEERFDAFEVADYLAATGRGNNAQAAATTSPRTPTSTAVSAPRRGRSASTGSLPSCAWPRAPVSRWAISPLTSIAHRCPRGDPDDSFLAPRDRGARAQTSDAGPPRRSPRRCVLLRPPRPLSCSSDQRVRRSCAGHAASPCGPRPSELVARIAVALAADAAGWRRRSSSTSPTARPTCCSRHVRRYAAELASQRRDLALDTRSARLARRRLRVHDLHRLDVQGRRSTATSSSGSAADGSVHVLQLPPAGQPDCRTSRCSTLSAISSSSSPTTLASSSSGPRAP